MFYLFCFQPLKTSTNVEIVSTRLHRDTMLADLTNRNLGISRAVAAPISHSLLRRDTYKVLMNKQNPLAQNRYEKVCGGTYITVNRASVEEIALQQLGISRPSLWRCQNYRAAADVVASTNALLTLPGLWLMR